MPRPGTSAPEFLLDNLDGAPHPNGGGWVSAQAHVAPSAYIGPRCVVLGKAKVLDHAQLIDSAAVIGDGAVVKDHAKLSGKARVLGIRRRRRVRPSLRCRAKHPASTRCREIADKKTKHMSGISSRRGIEAPTREPARQLRYPAGRIRPSGRHDDPAGQEQFTGYHLPTIRSTTTVTSSVGRGLNPSARSTGPWSSTARISTPRSRRRSSTSAN